MLEFETDSKGWKTVRYSTEMEEREDDFYSKDTPSVVLSIGNLHMTLKLKMLEKLQF